MSWQISQGYVDGLRLDDFAVINVPHRWSIRADTHLTVPAATPVAAPAPVACGIPGFDQPGQEVIADAFRVTDTRLGWDRQGRRGFAADCAYGYGD